MLSRQPQKRSVAASFHVFAALTLLVGISPLRAGDLQVYTSNEVSSVVAGATTTYGLTVSNGGVTAKTGVTVAQVFDPAHFERLDWTCLPEFPAGHLQFGAQNTGLPGADSVARAGNFLYVSTPANDAIQAFSRNPTTGALSFLATKTNGTLEGDGNVVSGLDGVRALATSPDGAFLYALSPVDDAVVVLKIGVTGLLDWVEVERDGVAGVDGLDQAAQLVVLAGHVYVSGSSDDAVAIFSRDGTTGRLTYQGKVADGLVQGPLTIDGLDGAAGLALSAGGEHLYVAGTVDGAVALFDRDAMSGALTYRDVWRTSDAAGLAGAFDLVLAPDGGSLHVAGMGSLVSLPRDTTPGATFGELGPALQQLQNGVGGLTGMAAPRALTVSADGAYLYLASPPDNNVLAFVRDPRGPLTLLERRRDGDAPFEGLGGASGLVLAGTGAQLYVAGASDGAIVTLQRDDATFCTAGGADDTVSPGLQLSDTVRLGVGGRLLYQVAARLRGSAVGVPCVYPFDTDRRCVSTTASSSGPDPASSIDVDYLSREADLAVSLADSVSTAVPGETVVYQLDVDNLGPSDAAGVGVLSFFPHAVAAVAWTCEADGIGASCDLAAGTGDIDFALATLPAGTGLRIEAVATLAAGGRGQVETNARVLSPALLLDPDAANNTASDVDTTLTPVAELELAASSQPPFYAGAPVEIGLTLTNHGPSDAFGVAVSGLWPGIVEMAEWSCVPPSWAGTPSLLETVAAPPGVSGVALSPDGANLYATGHQDGALRVFRRDRKNGALALLETLHEGDAFFDPVDNAAGTIAGLNGARAALVSADGQHVYVVGEVDDTLLLFRRVAPDGLLIFKTAYRDGEGGVSGLGGASALFLSPAGDHLYVAGEADDAIAIFARHATSGALTFLGVVEEGIAGMSGLLGVNALAISADGRHLYAASPGAGGVTVFARAETGLLTRLETLSTTPPVGPGRGLGISADGDNLYAAAGDALVVLLREASAQSPNFGRLTQLEALTEGDLQGGVLVGGLDDIGGISLSADGRQVHTRGQGTVGVFSRQVAELLAAGEAPGRLICHDLGGGTCARTFAGNPAGGLGAFAGENLYLPRGVAGQLEVLRLAPGSRCLPQGDGQLADEIDILAGDVLTFTLRGTLLSSATGQVDFSALAAVSAESDPGLLPNTAATSDPVLFKADLQLAKSDGVTTAIAGLPLAYTMTVSNLGPSDVHGITLEDVYPLFPAAPGGFTDGTLSWSCTGAAAAQWHQESRDGVAGVDGLSGALQMGTSPDGAYLYVVGSAEDAVAVFSRDALTGNLSFESVVREGDLDAGRTVVGLDGAADLALSGDGEHLYVAGENADSLVVFRREAGSGELHYVQTISAGIDGMNGAAAVLVSADGRFVYLAGKVEGTVVVFVRDPATGELAFLERERDGFGGVPAGVLLGARELLLTAGDRHLVVAAQNSDALVIFRRDAEDGTLTFLRALRDGDPQGEVAVDGLDMVFALAESPDRRFLYAAALADDAISRFAWDGEGELTYLGLLRHGLNGQLLDGAAALVLSPDGRYFFTAAANSDALSVFRRNDASGELERIEVLRQGQGGVSSLDNPRGLLAIGDDVYVSAATSNALGAIRMAPRAVCGSAGALGESPSPFELDAGATVELAAGGVVHPSARGNCDGDLQDLLSPLSAILPAGVLDENLPNLVTDGDDLRGHVDLSVSLTDNQVSVAAGTPVVYTAVVKNLGAPSNSLGARVLSSSSSQWQPLSWTCTAGPGATCGAATGTGPLDVVVDAELGSQISFELSGSVLSSATGTVQQRIQVLAGPCETDLVPANNTLTDHNAVIRVADLAISKTGPLEAEPGQVIFFEIVVSNLGPSDGEGQLSDLLPPQLRRAAWSCVASGAAECPGPPTGIGNLNVPVVLPAFSQATFTVAAEVEIAALGSLVNTARISAASTVIDALQANNSSSASVALLDVVIFHDGFESGDTTAWETFGLVEERDHAEPR